MKLPNSPYVLPSSPTQADLDVKIVDELKDKGDLETAVKLINKVLDDYPDHPGALAVAGKIFLKMGRYGLGYNMLHRAAEFHSDSHTWIAIAAACIYMTRLDECRQILRELRRVEPNNPTPLTMLCLLAIWDCQPKLAIELGEKSLAIKPDQWDAHEPIGYGYLMLNQFDKGFTAYERFIGKSKYRPIDPPHKDCPYWDGRDGLNLVVRGEQGIGDEIAFASILPDVIKTQKSVVLDAHKKLAGLFARSFPGIEVYGTRMDEAGEKTWREGRTFDAHCLIGSLALHKRKRDSDFPGTPFLVADHERRIQWRALLDTLPGKKVGIAWTGGWKNTFKERRSLSLNRLLPILKTEGISWVSLQYQDPTEEIEQFHKETGIKIHHWKRGGESEDYEDQAALVSELDLVISVTTSVIHLAGGLGKECWVLCPNKPQWFWNLEGRRIPWYKSVEIFRQTKEGQWPLDEVASRLEAWRAA